MATVEIRNRLRARLTEALGTESVRTSPEDLSVFSFDACSEDQLADVAVVPADAREVSLAVKIATGLGVPIVPRGAGTGLCGGAVPTAGGVVISFARMNRILSFDPVRGRARVQPGVVNLNLSHETEPHGLFYAPDPSSQKISTIGGNVATNAGGAHCLLYGTTVNHVTGLEFIDSHGEVVRTSIDDAGPGLVGAIVGSEGTLGIITAVDVRLMRTPPSVHVYVAAFGDIASASATVSAVIGAGIVPTAMEIMDRPIVQAVEAYYHAGYPTEAAAVLLVEVAGLEEDTQELEALIEGIARKNGAISWRSASSAAERAVLWASRKGAAGAMGRIAPNYYIQDATVPRTRLPEAVARIEEISNAHKLTVGNVFHAGDGNLHPLLVFDRRDKRQVDAVHDAGEEILHACIALGGTISGEHGIGFEKRETLGYVFGPDDLETMNRLRDVLDPKRGFNPDKIFPSGTRCGEVGMGGVRDTGGAREAAVGKGAWV